MKKNEQNGQSDSAVADTQSVPDCFKVRYASEAADMEFLKEKYKVKTFLDVAEATSGNTLFQLIDPASKLCTQLFPQFFPGLYRAANLTLDRLGLAEGVSFVRMYLLQSDDTPFGGPFARYINDENGVQFHFFVSACDIENLADDELAFFFGSSLAHWFYGIEYFMGLEKEQEDGEINEEESVLLPMGNELYGKWVVKSQISEDRVGALAAGGFEPATRALMKRKYRVSSQHLVIPRMSELDGIGEATASDLPIYNHLPFRLKALRLFCEDWYSPSRESCSLVAVDEAIDALFEKARRYPDDKSAEACMFLIADIGLELVALNGEPSDEEIRRLICLVWEFTDNPRDVFLAKKEVRANRIEASIAYVKDNGYEGDQILQRVIRDLSQLALFAGINADTKLDYLRELVPLVYGEFPISHDKSGDDEDDSDEYLSIDIILKDKKESLLEIIDNIHLNADNAFSIDPLMDNFVACAQRIIDGRPYKELKSPKGRNIEVLGDSMDVLRYSGDYESERMLKDVYHVEEFLKRSVEVASHEESSTQSNLTTEGVWLTSSISPRIFTILKKVTSNLKFNVSFKILCVNNSELNARAWREPTPNGDQFYIVVHSSTLERLDDDELAFVLGHEIGHLIFNHSERGYLRFHDNGPTAEPYRTKLPLMGDVLYREWDQKCEISADRMGVVASQNLEASLRAHIKVAYGLTDKNLLADNNTIEELIEQLEKVKDNDVLEGANLFSHPIDQLRLKAILLFGEAYLGSRQPNLKEVDKKIGEYFNWLRKKPRTNTEKAAMMVFATAGLNLVEQDGAIEEREIREILDTLVVCFTEDPLEAIIGNRQERNNVYQTNASELWYADEATKEHVMRLLVHLALSDGSISEKEQKFLARVADKINCDFDFKTVEEHVVQQRRFPVDFLLEDIVKEMRDAIMPQKKGKKQ